MIWVRRRSRKRSRVSRRLDASQIDDVIMGCAFPEAEQGMNVARTAMIAAGLAGRDFGDDGESLLLVGSADDRARGGPDRDRRRGCDRRGRARDDVDDPDGRQCRPAESGDSSTRIPITT